MRETSSGLLSSDALTFAARPATHGRTGFAGSPSLLPAPPVRTKLTDLRNQVDDAGALFEVDVSAVLQRLLGLLTLLVGGEDDDAGVRQPPAQLREGGETVHHRHRDVEQD